jgi:membrane-bound serine protease (ClpP class)
MILDPNNTGFLLLLLGACLIILEAVVFSFGILAIAGLIAFVAGSLFLLNTHVLGYVITWPVIIIMGLVSAVFCFIIFNLALCSFRKKIVTGREALIGEEGYIVEQHGNQIRVKLQGEIWKADSKKVVQLGQKVRVVRISGLLLNVEPSDSQ